MVDEEIEDDPLGGEEGPGDDDLHQIAEAEVIDGGLLADDEDLLVVDEDDDVVSTAGVGSEVAGVDEIVGEEVALDESSVVLVDGDTDDGDVEAGLDVILKERLVAGEEVDLEADDESDDADADDRHEATIRLLPKQANEFVCQSCFLVKHIGQLADSEKMLCRDCV